MTKKITMDKGYDKELAEAVKHGKELDKKKAKQPTKKVKRK